MRVSDMPRMGDEGWNAFRQRVISVLTDLEVWLMQTKRGMNSDVYAYEAAERLQLDIVDDFQRMRFLVIGLLPLAQEGLKRTATQDNGQFSLLLL